jgi:hypothetical protein
MELPNEIWCEIVKQSKKTNDDLLDEMNIDQLKELELMIEKKKSKIYDNIKSKIDKYDVIELHYKKDNWVADCVVLDTNLKSSNFIKVCELVNGNKKTIFGRYEIGARTNTFINLDNYNFKIKNKLEHRCRENINIANKLKIGDVFCYSMLTCAEWCKNKSRMDLPMGDFERYINYGVVEDITAYKIRIINYYRTDQNALKWDRIDKYIDKNLVLKKIEYDDEPYIYNREKSKFMFKCILQININKTDIINKDYFKHINKKKLIKLQKRFKISP